MAELCRKHGISDATFYTWRKRYGGMEVSDAKRLKALEDENARLKNSSPNRSSTWPRCGKLWQKPSDARRAERLRELGY